MLLRSSALIDRFIDALWVEDGLAALSLAAYRRDLSLLAAWLEQTEDRTLERARESDLLAYMSARHATTRAATANRRLTVLRHGSTAQHTEHWLVVRCVRCSGRGHRVQQRSVRSS